MFTWSRTTLVLMVSLTPAYPLKLPANLNCSLGRRQGLAIETGSEMQATSQCHFLRRPGPACGQNSRATTKCISTIQDIVTVQIESATSWCKQQSRAAIRAPLSSMLHSSLSHPSLQVTQMSNSDIGMTYTSRCTRHWYLSWNLGVNRAYCP